MLPLYSTLETGSYLETNGSSGVHVQCESWCSRVQNTKESRWPKGRRHGAGPRAEWAHVARTDVEARMPQGDGLTFIHRHQDSLYTSGCIYTEWLELAGDRQDSLLGSGLTGVNL